MTALTEADWEVLLRRIADGKCTPFLGPEVGMLRHGSEIAREWSQSYGYPFEDTHDLARVAQFMAVEHDALYPKEEIIWRFRNAESAELNNPYGPHNVLADLPLPIYITTNPDDFMTQALIFQNRSPNREICHWNKYTREDLPFFVDSEPGYRPTPANPLVFHLHGHIELPESLVLTEDDYLDFLVNISRDQTLLPPWIQMALAGTSLLFIGYGLNDRSLRVILRGLVAPTAPSLRRISLITPPQVPTEDMGRSPEEVSHYYESYLNTLDLRVYWGTAEEFAAELRRRWDAFVRDY